MRILAGLRDALFLLSLKPKELRFPMLDQPGTYSEQQTCRQLRRVTVNLILAHAARWGTRTVRGTILGEDVKPWLSAKYDVCGYSCLS